jgi:methyltransferase (TIGR00027 family)
VKDSRGSYTALGASVIRTVHQLIDSPPLILEDPISPLLLSKEAIERIKRNPARHQISQARGLRSHVVLRSRYAEDQLQQAVLSGVSQYINLGAGFDTFSLRQPAWTKGLRIIEVDHPASQRAKLKYFQNRGFSFPENTAFIPIDLEKADLIEELARGGVDLDRPVFVSCLGVLAYLSLQAVQKVFEGVARISAGSSFALAFAPKGLQGTVRRESGAAERAAEHGEPWLTYFTAEEVEALLKGCGFLEVEFLAAGKAAERYYKGRADLPAPRKTRLCMAKI